MSQKLKKAVAAALSAALIFVSVPARVTAEDDAGSAGSEWLSGDGKGYYYSQLDKNYKAAWQTDVDSILRYPKRKVAKKKNFRFIALSDIITLDNPKIFWVDWIDSYSRLCFYMDPDGVEDENLYSPVWPKNTSFEDLKEKFTSALEDAVLKIKKSLPENADDGKKARAIAEWLCDNNTYNLKQMGSKRVDPLSFSHLAAHSAYSSIVPGDSYSPVCEGYALGFKVLCDEFGVNCICISGESDYNGGHMWNNIEVDGKWYLVDVTNIDSDYKDGEEYRFTKFFMNNTEYKSYKADPYLGSAIKPGKKYEKEDCASFTFPKLYQKPAPTGISLELLDAGAASISGDQKSGYVIKVKSKDIPKSGGLNFLIKTGFLPDSTDWRKKGWELLRYTVEDDGRVIGFASYPGDEMTKQVQIKSGASPGEYTYRFRAADPDGIVYKSCTLLLTVKIVK